MQCSTVQWKAVQSILPPVHPLHRNAPCHKTSQCLSITLRILDSLAQFPPEVGLDILGKFSEANPQNISNKSGFMAGIMRRFRCHLAPERWDASKAIEVCSTGRTGSTGWSVGCGGRKANAIPQCACVIPPKSTHSKNPHHTIVPLRTWAGPAHVAACTRFPPFPGTRPDLAGRRSATPRISGVLRSPGTGWPPPVYPGPWVLGSWGLCERP